MACIRKNKLTVTYGSLPGLKPAPSANLRYLRRISIDIKRIFIYLKKDTIKKRLYRNYRNYRNSAPSLRLSAVTLP